MIGQTSGQDLNELSEKMEAALTGLDAPVLHQAVDSFHDHWDLKQKFSFKNVPSKFKMKRLDKLQKTMVRAVKLIGRSFSLNSHFH